MPSCFKNPVAAGLKWSSGGKSRSKGGDWMGAKLGDIAVATQEMMVVLTWGGSE